MAHNYVTSLKIVDSDGVDKGVTIGSNVVLDAGVNTAISVTEDKEIEITASSSIGGSDSDVLDKFNDVINGGGSFSGVPYYIGKIAGGGTDDGAFFWNVDRCMHLGQFLDLEHPETLDNKLGILDVCPACQDCPGYEDLYTHITTVKDAIDAQKDLVVSNEEDESSSGSGAGTVGVLNQYEAMIERWNYLVHLKSWRFNAEATGAEVHASCKYTNRTPEAIPAGLIMAIDFIGAPDPTRAYVIDTAVQGTITRGDLELTSGVGGSESEDDQSVQLVTTAPLEPGDGIRFYAGSLSPSYVGEDTRVTVNFELTVPSGGIGDHENSFTTNKMVVIEDWV
jgi:hypothetical protein